MATFGDVVITDLTQNKGAGVTHFLVEAKPVLQQATNPFAVIGTEMVETNGGTLSYPRDVGIDEVEIKPILSDRRARPKGTEIQRVTVEWVAHDTEFFLPNAQEAQAQVNFMKSQLMKIRGAYTRAYIQSYIDALAAVPTTNTGSATNQNSTLFNIDPRVAWDPVNKTRIGTGNTDKAAPLNNQKFMIAQNRAAHGHFYEFGNKPVFATDFLGMDGCDYDEQKLNMDYRMGIQEMGSYQYNPNFKEMQFLVIGQMARNQGFPKNTSSVTIGGTAQAAGTLQTSFCFSPDGMVVVKPAGMPVHDIEIEYQAKDRGTWTIYSGYWGVGNINPLTVGRIYHTVPALTDELGVAPATTNAAFA